jgi:NAD(P)-dependent dehydrogenase (short-subunit alcohol dehydrogenase family)
MDVRHRGVLVTGASRGLGASLARAFAERGARVVLVARGEAELERVAAAIRAEGGEAHAFAADVADKLATHRIAGFAQEVAGPIDVLVHNASALGPTPLRPLLDTECEDLAAVLEANVVGPFRLTKVIAGSMALRGTGLVVQVSSDAAVEAYANWGAYGISKAATDHLTRIFAAELGARGVSFVSVDPGEMDTEMHAAAIPEADRATLLSPDEVAARIARVVEGSDAIDPGARVLASAFARERVQR